MLLCKPESSALAARLSEMAAKPMMNQESRNAGKRGGAGGLSMARAPRASRASPSGFAVQLGIRDASIPHFLLS
ncbi:MAG: hypothetical protein AVDCRST_MAG42-1014 [uncultured Chthoniobacterales bacterium]|uniref:Uncharacterized protein n=1 Tax=uncultured Chthoniobacterales bacterium TaxID=1836801 RepID=A0A6J4HNK8_9BACT|nr:MAG: hypothetical protein AVDCRST_MAG42-1014 [uncultured Chthoniobacterales bacterium]